MERVRHRSSAHAVAGLMILLQLLAVVGSAGAASHREAPLIALDPAADITDVYFFRSWTDPTKVVLVMNVIPGQEPSSGPNYFNFDDQVRYAFHLDTNRNGTAENVVYEIRFKTRIQGVVKQLRLPVGYAAVPPITALSGPNAAGIGIRQTYTVTEIRNGRRRELGTQPEMVAVPSNIGPLTTPNYEALAAQGIYPLSNGGRVFAGQRDETFYIDLGATFDTVNLRRTPPILDAGEDANDGGQPVRGRHVLRVQREHDRPRDPDRRAHVQPERRARALRLDEPPEEPPPEGRRHLVRLGGLGAGGPHGEPARQRAHHPHGPEGPVERDRPEGRGPVRQLLPEPEPRRRPEPPLRHRVPDRGAHRPGRHAPPVRRRRHLREERPVLGAPAARPQRRPDGARRTRSGSASSRGTTPASRTGGGRTTT